MKALVAHCGLLVARVSRLIAAEQGDAGAIGKTWPLCFYASMLPRTGSGLNTATWAKTSCEIKCQKGQVLPLASRLDRLTAFRARSA